MSHQNRQNNIIFSEPQFNEVSARLAELAAKLQVSALLLVNSSGQIIARKVRDIERDSGTLATLAASTYSAGVEMARILGESANFKMVLHEGREKSIFISSVTPDFFLIVVFGRGVATGMVRLFTKKTIEALIPVVTGGPETDMRVETLIDREFQMLLNEKLDTLGD